MLGEHPEVDAELRYDFGCTWYSDHGPYYSGMQFVWLVIGFPCIAASLLALLSTCGFICWPRRLQSGLPTDFSTSMASSPHYGPLIDVSDVHINVDDDVHRWVSRGAYGAISYGVMLLILALFIALHANNEAEFSFLVDAFVALFMCASKIAVTLCVRTVHRHLSPMSRQVAKQWIQVLAVSKALTAVCAMVLVVIYLVLAIRGVDANRGDQTRRRLQNVSKSPTLHDDDDSDHGPTDDEKAELCALGFFMVWSFLITLISQSLAGFAFFRIYANAVHMFGDRFIFSKVVNCWWGILVGCTCGVGIALWLGIGICVFPALDISPLRMIGFFYSGGAVNQMLAGSAMLFCNWCIRSYWIQQNAIAPATVMGNTTNSTTVGRQMQIIVPKDSTPGMMLQVMTPEGVTVQARVPEDAASGAGFWVQY